jgi:hypothetical protein
LNGARKRAQTLRGYTRDLSQDGLGLLVSQVHLDGHHLAAGGRELDVELELGRDNSISMRVMPRRYERLEESESGCTYLIGAGIVSLAEADRSRYLAFVAENRSSRRSGPTGFFMRPEKRKRLPSNYLNKSQPKTFGRWKAGCCVLVGCHAR